MHPAHILTAQIEDRLTSLRPKLENDAYFSAGFFIESLAIEAIARNMPHKGFYRWIKYFWVGIFDSKWSAILLMRLACIFRRRGKGRINKLLCRLNISINGCEIHPDARILPPFFIFHPAGVVVGAGTIMGAGCMVHAGSQFVQTPQFVGGDGKYPRLGDRVFIGANTICAGGIKIGNGAVIGAMILVAEDVPEKTLVTFDRKSLKYKAMQEASN